MAVVTLGSARSDAIVQQVVVVSEHVFGRQDPASGARDNHHNACRRKSRRVSHHDTEGAYARLVLAPRRRSPG